MLQTNLIVTQPQFFLSPILQLGTENEKVEDADGLLDNNMHIEV